MASQEHRKKPQKQANVVPPTQTTEQSHEKPLTLNAGRRSLIAVAVLNLLFAVAVFGVVLALLKTAYNARFAELLLSIGSDNVRFAALLRLILSPSGFTLFLMLVCALSHVAASIELLDGQFRFADLVARLSLLPLAATLLLIWFMCMGRDGTVDWVALLTLVLSGAWNVFLVVFTARRRTFAEQESGSMAPPSVLAENRSLTAIAVFNLLFGLGVGGFFALGVAYSPRHIEVFLAASKVLLSLLSITAGLQIVASIGMLRGRERSVAFADVLAKLFLLPLAAITLYMLILVPGMTRLNYPRQKFMSIFEWCVFFDLKEIVLAAIWPMMMIAFALQRGSSGSRKSWIVIAVVACGLPFIMFGQILPATQHAFDQSREAMHRSSCKISLKQIGLALHNYHDRYQSFPPAFVADENGKPMHSWRVLLLPYLDERKLYEQYDFSQPWDSPANKDVLENMPSIYACPSSGGGNTTNYAGVFGPNCVFSGAEPVNRRDISDGSSNTIVVGEVEGSNIPWTKPEDIDITLHPRIGDPAGFNSNHAGGALFLLGDGAVRFIGDKIEAEKLRGLFTRNGGERTGRF